VTSPAKAGPVKASAKAKANVDTSIFMVLLLTVGGGARRTPFQRLMFHPQLIALTPDFLDTSCTQSLQTQFSIRGQHSSGGNATMSHLFAAILLFSSPGCPHEEPTCITPTEHVEVNLSTRILPYAVVRPVHSDSLRRRAIRS
jgi:hypothetical protein